MQRIICKNGKFSTDASEGAWQASYDGGPAAPCIRLGYGTGSTPTLMGFGSDEDKLVVITDGCKRMKLAALLRRDEIPTDAKVIEEGNPRLAGVFEVSCGLPVSTEWVQSEQWVSHGGYEAFVVNNIKETAKKLQTRLSVYWRLVHLLGRSKRRGVCTLECKGQQMGGSLESL